MGTTSLLLWENTGRVRLFSVEVTADAHGLERYLNAIMPEETIGVSATGNMVTLSGQVHDLSAAGRAVDIAKGSGATVIDNMVVPSAIQVMLQVRFAEVSRSVLNQFSSKIATLNPHELNSNGDWVGTSSTDAGVANLGLALLNVGDSLSLILRALQTKGELKTLAEPTLITLPGKEASFLAGGEFPYPTVQGGASGTNAVTIVFKEFGVKLRFTPTLTRNGYIRLRLAPEVSSLDFANALLINGFTVPSLLTRRAETEVEMREGQHLSIAGLLDNSTLQSVAKIPLLGDIPILGQLFRSKDARQRRTELLVIVTPTLVQAGDTLPRLPTGEPGTWKWEKSLRDSVTPTGSRH
jgi:pilus assembly protein CpaC